MLSAIFDPGGFIGTVGACLLSPLGCVRLG